MTEAQANAIYFKMYHDMINADYADAKLGFGHDKITTTKEINTIGKRLFGNKFLGAFAQDKLPKKIFSNKQYYAIANVDTTGMPGTHWIAIAGLPHNKRSSTKPKHNVMVFDSFGRMTKKLLPLIYKASRGGAIDTQHDQEQKLMQDSCGQYSMAWLLFFDKYGKTNAQKI